MRVSSQGYRREAFKFRAESKAASVSVAGG
jgi:hypothetical protein